MISYKMASTCAEQRHSRLFTFEHNARGQFWGSRTRTRAHSGTRRRTANCLCLLPVAKNKRVRFRCISFLRSVNGLGLGNRRHRLVVCYYFLLVIQYFRFCRGQSLCAVSPSNKSFTLKVGLDIYRYYYYFLMYIFNSVFKRRNMYSFHKSIVESTWNIVLLLHDCLRAQHLKYCTIDSSQGFGFSTEN